MKQRYNYEVCEHTFAFCEFLNKHNLDIEDVVYLNQDTETQRIEFIYKYNITQKRLI